MRPVHNLRDLKELLQAGFENNEESLEAFGKTYSTQLKAYLIERNPGYFKSLPGAWEKIDSVGWYINADSELSNNLFLD